MPDLDLARAFLKACGTPVAAPSANRSGGPSPTTWDAVAADLEGRIACILKGPPADAGLESTVVDCTAEPPLVLRPGIVTLDQLQAVWPTTRYEATGIRHRSSPGTRYRHYAPSATVVLVDHPRDARPGPNAAYLGLTRPNAAADFALALTVPTLEAYAHEVYAFFRRCDAAGVGTIYCQAVAAEGLGLALMDRLRRAAENGSAPEA
jgi:L-threonylcarbamoyladenylate synthase